MIELLVASALAMLVLTLVLASIISNKRLYQRDITATRLNQNLRSAIDIVGMNARQAGEALAPSFPAIEVINGEDGAPDELILRRNLFENEVLNVCEELTAGTSGASVLFAYDTSEIACAYSAELAGYLTTWLAHLSASGGETKAYIYNRSTKLGEFFSFTGGLDTGTELYIQRESGEWENTYPGDGLTAAMYLLEEYRFSVSDGLLQLLQNGEQDNLMNIIDGVTDFQVIVRMQDSTTKDSFSASDQWTAIKSLEVTLSGSDTSAGRIISSVLRDRLFPRNILSH